MNQPLKVVVFGATGQTGVCLVRSLIAAGHSVTAFVRDPAKASAAGFGADVRLVQGDGRDAAAVARAVAGQDAVVAAIGPRSLKRDDLQEAITANLVKAMESSGVKRLVDLSARGAGDSIKHNKLAFTLFQKTVLRNIYIDKNKAEALILASGLDYTLVRPGRLENKPAKGGVRASLDGKVDGKNLSLGIARADVAAFMVAQLGDPSWVRSAPLIGY